MTKLSESVLGWTALAAVTFGSFASWRPAIAQVFTDPPKSARPAPPKKQPKPRATKRAAPAPAVAVKPAARSYDDPAPYCSAHPNDDQPGTNYVGPASPEWLGEGARLAGPATVSAGLSWRCQQGKVLVCSEAATQVCGKPNQERTASAAVRAYCATNRNAPVPPSTGGNTVATWSCRDGAPIVAGYLSGLDARGFIASAWRDVTAFAPSNRVGAVPGYFIGEWQGAIKGKGHFFKVTYAVALTVVGGRLGSNAGVVGYYGVDLGGKTFEVCASNVVLRSFAEDRFLADERLERKGPPAFKCPAQSAITMQLREGQLWVEWLDAKGKMKMSGALQRSK